MRDTADVVAALAAERHARMTPEERLRIASAMFDDARAIVRASLPPELTPDELRLALVKRFYGDELPEAALLAYARRSQAQSP